jgi:tRNA threonylcarbamoyladenosine biosynthesis protein TsaE
MPSLRVHETDLSVCAEHVARAIRPGVPVLLFGPMGVGKSTFARALLRILIPNVAHIPSPSFPIMMAYSGSQGTIWHVDLYRIEVFSDIAPLGLNETIMNDCCIIEWPDRLGPWMPKQYITVSLDFVRANQQDDTGLGDQVLWREIAIDLPDGA